MQFVFPLPTCSIVSEDAEIHRLMMIQMVDLRHHTQIQYKILKITGFISYISYSAFMPT